MRLYSDAGTTTEITANNQYIGITDQGIGNLTGEINVLYTQAAGVVSVTSCNLPTPTPTPSPSPSATPGPTPTPTPTSGAGFSQSISNASATSPGGCTMSFSGTKYTAVSYANLTIGTVVYNDSGLTTIFNGNNQWYRFGQGTGSGQSYLVLINTSGGLQQIFNC